ncbi:putative response regulator receiver protein [Candidatus Nitrososphaera gargensis Ga9.2]|uniref:Putative response regulator receiver protein n=1 Tax=Nitrososphaera gargensis (strain Ga9.2) TaxID=1237085 RepID=K0I917_NITGG|nr:putative response regulator receiver protein [Candidatus Nitrososphaera gargensis Ga9.2]
MRMPGMNGFELARKVKAANPEIKIFLMSAFELSISEFEKVLPSIKVNGMLEKPVSMHMLVSLIVKQL